MKGARRSASYIVGDRQPDWAVTRALRWAGAPLPGAPTHRNICPRVQQLLSIVVVLSSLMVKLF